MKTRELELAKSLKSMEIEIVEGGGQQDIIGLYNYLGTSAAPTRVLKECLI